MIATFDKHPSKILCELFKTKPYQGQTPEDASIIFLEQMLTMI